MKRIIAAAWLALVCAGTVAAADFDFQTAVDYSTGGRARSVVAGDVNGDGLDDAVLVTNGYYFDPENDSKLFVFLQNKNGGLDPPLKYTYGTDPTLKKVQVALGDLNKDGIKDIVVCQPQGLTLYVADGSNGFSEQRVYAYPCTGLGIVDIDLDGNLDIVGQGGSVGATLFYGDGHGGIRSTEHMDEAYGAEDMEIGDVTGDGLPDMVIVSGPGIAVYPHNQSSGFGPGRLFTLPNQPGAYAGGVGIGDFDLDGRNEVAVSISANMPDAAIWLYAQDGSGGLAAPTRLTTYQVPASLIATDLDRDGRQDLLVGHQGWGELGRYMQGNAGLDSEILTPARYTEQWRALATGDINDDGCTDALAAENGSGFSDLRILPGAACVPVHATTDLNGDGRSDVVWRNVASGEDAIWFSANSATSQAMRAVTDIKWVIVGTGDFDGDGRADVLWHSTGTGANAIWRSGDSSTAMPVKGVTDLKWEIVGVGDFNGDSKADILWRHASTGADAIWLSGNASTPQSITGVTNTQWRVVGTGDFDGDGRTDIFWRNGATGADAIWRSGNSATSQSVTDITDLAWQVAGIADFDGDGKDDVLWRNGATGANVIWRSADFVKRRSVAAVDIAWDVAATGDYDGNRKADILWRNRQTGANVIWRAAKGAVQLPVRAVTDLAWRMVP